MKKAVKPPQARLYSDICRPLLACLSSALQICLGLAEHLSSGRSCTGVMGRGSHQSSAGWRSPVTVIGG